MAEQLVSVILPVLNCERYVAQALRSVLGQTHGELEVIVVDGGSNDGTLEVLRSFEKDISLIVDRGRPLARGRNVGAAAARGDYLAFQDADDLWEPRKLELQLQAVNGQDAPELVFGHVRQFASPELDPDVAARFAVPDIPQPARIAPAMLGTRQAFERLGRFSEDGFLDGFLDWLARAVDLGVREHIVPEVVLLRRRHPDSLTATHPELLVEYPRALKAALDRRRAGTF